MAQAVLAELAPVPTTAAVPVVLAVPARVGLLLGMQQEAVVQAGIVVTAVTEALAVKLTETQEQQVQVAQEVEVEVVLILQIQGMDTAVVVAVLAY